MDHVLPDLQREVTADRARSRLERVGRPDDLPRCRHRLVSLEHHRHERPGGDELDKPPKKPLPSCSA